MRPRAARSRTISWTLALCILAPAFAVATTAAASGCYGGEVERDVFRRTVGDDTFYLERRTNSVWRETNDAPGLQVTDRVCDGVVTVAADSLCADVSRGDQLLATGPC